MTDAPGDAPAPLNAGGPTLVVLAAGRAKRYGGVKPLAPVGPTGEAVIDVLASDALAAGWRRIVLVVGPETGPAIRYHVERMWPADVDVRFARQEVPRGTVDAVLAAADHLADAPSFGVANADDLYGETALSLLAGHVAGPDPANALVAFQLGRTLIGESPVTRGICAVGADGLLGAVDERRQVTPEPDGRIVAHDGRVPAALDPGAPVSMNLWGVRHPLRAVLEAAMADAPADGEVLLPEVIDDLLAGRRAVLGGADRFRVLPTDGRCIGVTHPGDLALVQAALAAEIGRGERDAQLWSAVSRAGARG